MVINNVVYIRTLTYGTFADDAGRLISRARPNDQIGPEPGQSPSTGAETYDPDAIDSFAIAVQTRTGVTCHPQVYPNTAPTLWKFGMDRVYAPVYNRLMRTSTWDDSFNAILRWDFEYMAPCHGEPIAEGAKGALRRHLGYDR